jgi:hypothetical protein
MDPQATFTTNGPTAMQTATKIAREKAAIEAELDRLLGALSVSHDVVSQLQNRVSPISSNLPRSDETDSPADSPGLGSSDVYRSISEAVTGVYSLQRRINDIIAYLEV